MYKFNIFFNSAYCVSTNFVSHAMCWLLEVKNVIKKKQQNGHTKDQFMVLMGVYDQLYASQLSSKTVLGKWKTYIKLNSDIIFPKKLYSIYKTEAAEQDERE